MQRWRFYITSGIAGMCVDPTGDYYDADEVDAEIARLRKALVWSAGRNLEVTGMGEGRRWFFRDTIGRTEFDGTDAFLIETLCRLAEGE